MSLHQSTERTSLAVPTKDDLESLSTKGIDSHVAERFRETIMARLPVYQMLAQESGFCVELGDKTCWDHSRRTVILNIDDFMGHRMNLDPSMVDYLILHELGHMKEMYDDPDGYRDIIECSKDKFGDAAFRLYNCMMDIFVNTHTAQVAPIYGNTFAPSEQVKNLYRTQAFAQRDFSGQPECLQFAHYLLNLGMGVADDITLSPAVQKRIDAGLTDLTGQTMSYKDFVDLYMRPQISHSQGKSWRGSVSQRKRIIDRLLRPEFETLLEGDLASGRAILVPGIRGIGSVLSNKSIKDILDDADENPPPGPLSAADRETLSQLHTIGEDLQMPVSDINDFANIFMRMRPTINSLAAVWDELVIDRLTQGYARQGFYVTGCDLDIQRAVSRFAQIETSPESAHVMYRRVPHEERIPAPCHFNLRLIIDTSGSMTIVEKLVRETAVALGASLYVKNQESALKGDRLTCGLEVRRFSGGVETILPCTENLTVRELMQWFPQVTMGGGTADHIALMDIDQSLDPATVSRIQSGSQVEIVIEITDGDTCNPTETKRQLKKLESKGVLTGAINLRNIIRPTSTSHISQASDVAVAHNSFAGCLFEQIWNSGPFKRGLTISTPEQLPESIRTMIQRFIETSGARLNRVGGTHGF